MNSDFSDNHQSALTLCNRNINQNSDGLNSKISTVFPRYLDWFERKFRKDPTEFSWSDEDLARLEQCDLILASDGLPINYCRSLKLLDNN